MGDPGHRKMDHLMILNAELQTQYTKGIPLMLLGHKWNGTNRDPR